MKVYPKVPRHDHPVVPDGFFDADDLLLVEKFDGSSFRFVLYDERYDAVYPEQVVSAADGDGSLVFGTRRQIRGSHRDPLDPIDGALHRAVRSLRTGIDKAVLRRAHDEFGCPVAVYAENMIYSTVDYGFTEQAVPALVGFDLLPFDAIETMTPKGNPYEETFEGFCSAATAWELFERLQVPTVAPELAFVPATQIDQPASGFDPETYTVPESSLANVRMEGVVARSDEWGRRVKILRDGFQERNREQFGMQPDDAETGAEYIVATYCTSGRIRSVLRQLVVEEGREFGVHLNEELHERVVEDIWAENWQELMTLDRSFTPVELYPLVAQRCITELRSMATNAELNDVAPTEIWTHLE